MFPIVAREHLGPLVTLYEVVAPKVARRHRAGQFVMLRPGARSERIPLTVADTDREKGTITLVVQSVGKTTVEMEERFFVGDAFHDVAGPLGMATHIGIPGRPDDWKGTVACVAGGIGAAPILPIARAFKKAGHEVVTILGARSADLLILEDRLGATSDRLLVCTDDGSRGRKGFVTHVLKDLIEAQRARGEDVHAAIAIGPPLMMKFCSEATRPYGVPTLVSLNTIMVDGTGMCGGCRVSVGGRTLYACVDGPEFDAHAVDFGMLADRLATYREQEQRAVEQRACLIPVLADRAEAEAAR